MAEGLAGDVIVRLRVVDEFSGVLRKFSETTQNVTNGLVTTTTTLDKYNKKGILKVQQTTEKLTKATKKFRFEFLGIMFAGMQLQRIFGGLTQAGFALYNVMEYFSATMGMVMLPVMDLLAPVLFDIFDWFMNLPEEAQFAIGAFLLFGQAIGGAMFNLAQMILLLDAITKAGGLGALLKTFESLTMIPKKIITDFIVNVPKDIAETLKGNLNTAFGKAFVGIIGAAFVFDGMLRISKADATMDMKEKLIGALETSLGAAMLFKAIGPVALVAVGIGLFINNSNSSGDLNAKVFGAIQNALGAGLVLRGLGMTTPAAVYASIAVGAYLLAANVAPDFNSKFLLALAGGIGIAGTKLGPVGGAIAVPIILILTGALANEEAKNNISKVISNAIRNGIVGGIGGGGVGSIFGGVGAVPGAIISGLGFAIGSILTDLMPHAASGGFTGGYEGPVYVHPNEYIIPAAQAQGMFSSNITVNANVSSDYDVNRMADILQDRFRNEFRSRSLI